MGWYEAVKDAISAADKLRNTELNQKLVDVQMECMKLAEDNVRLRQELLDVREKLQTRQDMEYRDNVYWQRLENGSFEGPYCPKCLDGSDKKVRMQDRPDDHWWRCQVCNCTVQKPGPGPSHQTVSVLDNF